MTTRDPRTSVDADRTAPFSIPAIRALESFDLHPKVTFFVGENGSGKSTLIEAIAVAARFNAEGGSQNFNFATRRSESELHTALRLVRGVRRPKTGYFLRAESYFNVATEVDRIAREVPRGQAVLEAHGGRSLHEQSHGESFLALVHNRFYANREGRGVSVVALQPESWSTRKGGAPGTGARARRLGRVRRAADRTRAALPRPSRNRRSAVPRRAGRA
jgi:predicted ATPase